MAKPEANSEEHTVELVTHAPAVADLKICCLRRPQRHPRGEAMIVGDRRRTCRLLLRFEDTGRSFAAGQTGRLADALQHGARFRRGR